MPPLLQGCLYKFTQMLQALSCLLGCPTFDTEDNVSRAFVLNGLDDPIPVQDAFTTGATHGRTGHLAALVVRLFDRDVLGVQVHKAISNRLQPFIRVMPTHKLTFPMLDFSIELAFVD